MLHRFVEEGNMGGNIYFKTTNYTQRFSRIIVALMKHHVAKNEVKTRQI